MAHSNDLSLRIFEDALEKAGHPRDASFHGQRPFVAVVSTPWESGERGRYLPSRNGILVAEGPDEDIATAHEFAHYLTYRCECGGTSKRNRTRCGYIGTHGPKFYRRAARVYKEAGISVERALAFERSCNYQPPASWARKKEW